MIKRRSGSKCCTVLAALTPFHSHRIKHSNACKNAPFIVPLMDASFLAKWEWLLLLKLFLRVEYTCGYNKGENRN